ncbi:alcohol dehydrogenase YqhD [mine drainage metagenome]|uniref:Alcohol dehydrogenase YqhD n=1 Tax=mine drainage metagenome TaxID=410659 RepID=A0A1J5SED7_9ZZZZ
MENFTFHNPTRIHFGRGQIAKLTSELNSDSRILLLAGGGSIRTNGVYTQVKAALGSHPVFELWGVEANPDYDTLMKAVDLCRRERINLILAVGGGSVLDGAKFVAAAVPFKGEPWDILAKNAPVESALPIGAVLTLPATGSEANGAAVISRRAIGEKLAFLSPHIFPRFSIIDPETTFSLPARQVGNGIGDAFTHVMEQYLTYPVNAEVQDRFAESILRILIEVGPKTLATPTDYDLRANLCWAATWALNTAIGMGVPQDWASHVIGHEITALHGVDHARTLAIVLPSLMNVQQAQKRQKILQYGARVWGITEGSEQARVDATIAKTRGFYESIGLKTHLSDYGIDVAVAANVANRLAARGVTKIGERGDITPETVEKILRQAA